jgi:2,3-bisphosphoglycerate-dependent phosphoglycerate mutase
MKKTVQRGPGKYLVVAHAGILNEAMRVIVGAQPPVNRSGTWFDFTDTGFARWNYNPDHH